MERVVKLLPVGAISITVHIPFAVDQIEDLVAYHDLQFSNGSLNSEVRQLAEELRRELAPYYVRPVAHLTEEEAYTVFCIDSPLVSSDGAPLSAEGWLQANRRPVAALLTQEPDIAHLSKQEAEESTARYLSYYERDLVVVDWDAALLVDERQHFDEALYVMELANLQLAELEAYDRILDDSLERAYRDLSGGRRVAVAARASCASCAKSALTWRASATSSRTSRNSSAIGTSRTFTRTSPRAFTLPIGTARLTTSCKRSMTSINCSTTTRPIAGC